jgi:hypothetical protein
MEVGRWRVDGHEDGRTVLGHPILRRRDMPPDPGGVCNRPDTHDRIIDRVFQNLRPRRRHGRSTQRGNGQVGLLGK